MPYECVLSLDNVTLVRPALCTSLVTRLDDRVMPQVCHSPGRATGC